MENWLLKKTYLENKIMVFSGYLSFILFKYNNTFFFFFFFGKYRF